MKKNVFSTLSARAALALAASLLIGLSSCKKEKSGSKPDPVGDSVTMTTGIAVGGTINLWFAIGDEPSVEGADETESKEEYGWLKKQYTLKAQNLVIKGKVTKLVCSTNTLTSLDVRKNTKLTMLDCSWTSLTSLDVSGNTGLKHLNCSNNALTSLDVSSNTELTELYCFHNALTSLDVNRNTKLEKLDCSSNQLTFLDVSSNTALTELKCYENKLTFGELKLPKLSKEGNLYFKYPGDSQTLTEDEVEKIKNEKNWTVLQRKGGDWVDYPGE